MTDDQDATEELDIEVELDTDEHGYPEAETAERETVVLKVQITTGFDGEYGTPEYRLSAVVTDDEPRVASIVYQEPGSPAEDMDWHVNAQEAHALHVFYEALEGTLTELGKAAQAGVMPSELDAIEHEPGTAGLLPGGRVELEQDSDLRAQLEQLLRDLFRTKPENLSHDEEE